MPEYFVWTTPDGRNVNLAPFEQLPTGVFRKVRNLSDMDATFTLIEAATDAEGLEVLDSLPVSALDGLFDAWQKASVVTTPES